MRARPGRVAAAVVLPLVALLGVGRGTAAPIGHRSTPRVLIVSLPGVAWADVHDGDLPTLDGLVGLSAIGDLAIRIGRQPTTTTAAYLTIGAGTRAVAPTVERAVALDPDETYEGVRAADILERRIGAVPAGAAYLAAGAAQDRNERSSFGAEPGLLGDLLEDASVRRAVIANADAAEGFVSDEPTPDGAYARAAVTALMGSSGVVPGGVVGRSLLLDDPEAPYGRRLDHEAVLAAFDEAWSEPGRAVVLVEASDLSRAAGYERRSSPEQAAALRSEALARSDSLLAALLAHTDPARDAIMVISPVAPTGAPDLTVALLRAPGVDPGLLQSASTRRAGYVQLADIAPTVLGLLGVESPEDIEGRPFEVRGASGDRIERLVSEAAAAEFRDDLMPVVVPAVIGALVLLVGAATVARRARERWLAGAQGAAFCILGVVPATFLLGRVDVLVHRLWLYLAVLVVLAGLIGGVTSVIDRRRPGTGLVASVGLIVMLFIVDVLVGAPLQVNSVFGYSVAVAGRFVGIGNLAFSLFGAATIVLAALLVDRRGPGAVPWAVGLLSVVVLIEGLPMLGADVGGVVSMVPAFGVTALVLTARRVRTKDVGVLAIVAGVAVVGFAFVDAARPEGSRTHLARLAEHLRAGRIDPLIDTLHRRLQASFGDAETAAWALVVGLIVLVGAYVVLHHHGRLTRLGDTWLGERPTVAAGAGLSVLASLGLLMNDSSIAVPTTMLIVVAPVLVCRAIAPTRPRSHLDMAPE